MGERLYRFASIVALAFWMGGFTFYALVVIPIGHKLLGKGHQAEITQQVTYWLNLSGILTLVILLPAVRRSKLLVASWVVMLVTLVLLFGLHPRLAAFMSPEDVAVDRRQFYRWHQAYLLVSTVQWLAALAYMWGFCASSAPISVTRPQPYDMREKNMAC